MNSMGRSAAKVRIVGAYLILLAACFAILFPVFWAFINSLKPSLVYVYNPAAINFPPTLNNYVKVFTFWKFGNFFLNTAVVATSATVISLIAGTLSAYSFARFGTGGKRSTLWVLAIRMLPAVAIILPLYILFDMARLLDTWPALILAHITFLLPMVIWMMCEFIRDVPTDLEEAATVDGCSRFGAFLRVVLPVVSPGLAATAIFCFLMSFNEFMFALILTGAGHSRTLPVALSAFWTSRKVMYGEMFAAVICVLAPELILAFSIQKYLVRGLTLGALKG